MERTLTDLVALAKVLYQEEQKAFHAAMAEDTDRCTSLGAHASQCSAMKRAYCFLSAFPDCSNG